MRLKGSYTVEAVIIVPTIMFIIIGLIYLAFILHNRILLKIYACRSADYIAAHMVNNEDYNTGKMVIDDIINKNAYYKLDKNYEDECDNMENVAWNMIEGKLIAAEDIEVTVSADNSKVSISYSCSMEIPILNIIPFFESDYIYMHADAFSYFTDSAELIRLYNSTIKNIID